ncbi:hypothetical protein ACJJTC_001891 [Scirpophaga incertulas]
MNNTPKSLLENFNELSNTFNERMSEFETRMQQSSSEESTKTVKSLAADYFTFKTFVWKALGLLKSQIETMALGYDRLDAQSRRKNLLFHGIDEDADEDCLSKLLHVLADKMHLSNLGTAAVEVCHRLGPNNKDTSRPILVRFTTVQQRSTVWNKKKVSLKGSKIMVTEFLTKSRQELFVAARKHFGMKKCWTSEGTVE